ncbi:MAG: hypothetical protein CMJ81_06490 [Planctomycetaceae bacterium]|nr:hypothetical protein [Planctomycetaceae bacterium]MBP63091.1 hypothetical protein [Planctomycetaceae bacterium]
MNYPTCYFTAIVLLLAAFPAGGEELWSLQPLLQEEVPAVRQADWPTSDLDSFVLARLEALELTPVGDAGPLIIIRRASFDLTGLPPDPADVNDYLADERPDRFQRLVDRLLASPQFGEKWARHWLDVARFAESSGKEFNFTYPHAWPYRNYVIEAFNVDKPYDRFLQEQLAGDLLAKEEHSQDKALKIAPAFLALGPKRHYANETEFRADVVDEQIDVTMRAVMGLTVSCARCHDHKMDPISMRDYYSLAGIFYSSQPLYGTISQRYSNHPTTVLPIGTGAQALHNVAERHEEKIKVAAEELEKQCTQLDEERKRLSEIESQELDGDSDRQQVEVDSIRVKMAKIEAENVELTEHKEQLESARPPRPAYTISMCDRDAPSGTKIASGGNPTELVGEEIPRGFLTCLTIDTAALPSDGQSGRLELARWITHKQNPLAARVMVNRIWHHLFGRGLVETVDNFGALGKPPSHPALLDRLAWKMHSDWSNKRLIRSIVCSRTYRLGSQVSEAGNQLDADNRYLWRMSPRRLQVEAIRDSMLLVSGSLDLAPPVGSTVTGLGDRLVRDVELDLLQPPSNHRSVYLPVVRDYLPKIFELFDFPSPNLVNGSRTATAVPTQDLYLQHDPDVIRFAQLAAERLLSKNQANNRLRAATAHRWALTRTPREDEIAGILELVSQVEKMDQTGAETKQPAEVIAWSAVFRALFGCAEFRYLVDVDESAGS